MTSDSVTLLQGKPEGCSSYNYCDYTRQRAAIKVKDKCSLYVQVKDINLSKESPCGHGIVTCFSIYGGRGGSSGSDLACNFAADPSGPPQGRLWVDTMLDDQVSLFSSFSQGRIM